MIPWLLVTLLMAQQPLEVVCTNDTNNVQHCTDSTGRHVHVTMKFKAALLLDAPAPQTPAKSDKGCDFYPVNTCAAQTQPESQHCVVLLKGRIEIQECTKTNYELCIDGVCGTLKYSEGK